VAARWVETILLRPHTPALLETVIEISRQTGDSARDLPPAALQLVRRACEASPDKPRLLRRLTGEEDTLTASSRTYGEALPEGLVLAGAAQ